MKTPIVARDLTKQPPHSPRERFGGFAILARTTDKCRAQKDARIGEYHFDCPLDNQLFKFKGINGEQFKKAVGSAETYEQVADWLLTAGTKKSQEEIKAWSDEVEARKLKDLPQLQKAGDGHGDYHEICRQLNLDDETATLFDWLEADDEASFHPHLQPTGK